MSVSLQSKLGVKEGEHCSQGRIPPSPIRSIEEGVKRIEQILNKKVLCRHDVQDINQAFQTLDQLERQITAIPPGCNSTHALQTVVDKITELVKYLSADNLISLYHLRNFIDKEGLPIDQCFHTLKEKFNYLQDIDLKKEMASNLPYCHSAAEFDRDTEVLVGSDRSREVTDILDQKRTKLKNNARLNCLREKEYPSYFQELLENGYTHLFDHLIEMRDLPSLKTRRAIIERMTFSEISHVILETQSVMIQKVERSISMDCQNVLFLLGRSGVGSSTVYCYLRRDKMVSKGSRYESRDDISGFIGQDEKRSCTFLPAVQKVEDWTIVDFPGFENSNALLIKLGLELALKALVKQYHPKILVLEAITNREGKFANAAALGKRLERLLGDDKKNCGLGLTKYSEDPDDIQIKDLERQENEYLTPTREESECIGEIKTLSALQMSDLEPIIEQKKKELEVIRQKREQQLLSLDIESQKAACRKRIEERENEFLIQIGLSKKISFGNLADPRPLSLCFQMLSDRSPRIQLPVQGEIEECLDPEDKSLLEHLLVNNLLREIKIQEEIKFEDIKALEQNILKFSLFEIVTDLLSLEIGRLIFRLKEVDPQLVRKYEKKIVLAHINGYMNAVINAFDIVLIDIILKARNRSYPHAHSEGASNLEKIKVKLRDYIVGSLGIALLQNEELANRKWNELQKKHQQMVDKVPAVLESKRSRVRYDAIAQTIDEYSNKLNQIYDKLLRLNYLRKFIKSGDDIKAAFESSVINTTSLRALLESIEVKIQRVRDVYGIEDWDRRVSFLVDKGIITNLESSKIEFVQYIHYILIYTYYLIEPDVKIAEYTHSDIERSTYFIVAVGKSSLADLKERAVENHRAHSNAQQPEKFNLKIRFKNEIISLMLEGNKQKLNIGLKIDLTSHDHLTRSLSAAAVLKSLEASDWYKNLRREGILYSLFQ